MAYTTQADIERYTGMSYNDFKENGQVMTPAQFATMIAEYIPFVEQIIHRYCNVTSFEPTTAIVEYHSGRGANDDEMGGYSPRYFTYGLDTQGTTYLMSDKTFYLKEVFYQITSVEEDVSPKTTAPSWVTRTQRTTGVAGDYEVRTKDEVTSIVFHNNIPMYGEDNVRITYYCGYGTTSKQYGEIKLAALRMMSNLLMAKKKIQEVTTIRAQGIRDFSQMMDIMNESAILSDNVTSVLSKYKRYQIAGPLYD